MRYAVLGALLAIGIVVQASAQAGTAGGSTQIASLAPSAALPCGTLPRSGLPLPLGSKGEWTPETGVAASLGLRTGRMFIEPSGPVSFSLAQVVPQPSELAMSSIRVTLHRPDGAKGSSPGEPIKQVGVFDTVPRDLIANPMQFAVDFGDVPDGRVVVRAEAMAGARVLGATGVVVYVQRGLDERLRRLESGAASLRGFEMLRAEVLYPSDYVRKIDRCHAALGAFDLARELAAAEAAHVSLQRGVDPFAQRTGDIKRHYLFEEAGEIMPYRLYIPSSYTGARSYPLLVALHGNGGTEDTFFDGFERRLTVLAEQRGYIVAAPLGYRNDGAYGFNATRTSLPMQLQKLQLSEKDVLHVLDLVRRHYRVDDERIYLAGHSAGGTGAWYLGPKYANLWAALAVFAGRVTPEEAPQVRQIPQFIVQGDADTTVPVQYARDMVAELKRLGIVHQYVEVAGGTHSGSVAPNLPAMFDFLDRHRKQAR
jgi:poly(3-hydroxybutyrate) depolymerase